MPPNLASAIPVEPLHLLHEDGVHALTVLHRVLLDRFLNVILCRQLQHQTHTYDMCLNGAYWSKLTKYGH